LRRKIGTMNVLVTLGALGEKALLPTLMSRLNIGSRGIAPIFAYRITSGVETVCAIVAYLIIDTGGVEMDLVTLHTEERLVLFQEVVGDGAVGIMANGAIFDDRFVFENKGTLVAGVAGQAEVVQALFGAKHTGDGISGAMGIVAIGTAHVAFLHRVARDEKHLGLHVPVTLTTELKLVSFGQELRIRVVMHLVAINTGHVVFRMLGAKPVHGLPTLVAGEAHGVGFFSLEAFFPEAEDLFGITAFVHVRRTRAVTPLTTHLVTGNLIRSQPHVDVRLGVSCHGVMTLETRFGTQVLRLRRNFRRFDHLRSLLSEFLGAADGQH